MNIILLGRKHYAAQALEWTISQNISVNCVCTEDDAENGDLIKTANMFSIPIVDMEAVKDRVTDKQNAVDLIVSYLYSKKIKEPLISGPQYGCINFHPAILPDWRGTAGYNIAIIKGLDEWGATVHYVDENIDTGPIIKTKRFKIDSQGETAYSLEKKTQEVQLDLFKETLLAFEKLGKLPGIPQKIEDGTYITRKEMNEMKLIDIQSISDNELDNMIRAFWFPPYSGASFIRNGKQYTIIDEEILKGIKNGDYNR